MESIGAPSPDLLLGASWVSRRIPLKEHPSAKGLKLAVLVHRDGIGEPRERAALLIPGFLDYFFQEEHAHDWTNAGIEFYALDQRGQGRATINGTGLEAISDLRARHVEIAAAIAFLRRQGHRHITLIGHSTGGLQAVIYAADQVARGGPATRPDALILNSPWLAIAEPAPVRIVGSAAARLLSPVAPRIPLTTLSGVYARGLHKDFGGEWDFDERFKPLKPFPVRAGFLASVRNLQRQVENGLDLPQPILLATSARHGTAKNLDSPDLRISDTILNPDQMVERAPLLGKDVRIERFDGGVHDLSLSSPPVRAAFAETAIGWSQAH